MGKRMSQETELRGSATKNGSTPSVTGNTNKLATRNAQQIQDATRIQIESLSDTVSSQMLDAVIERSAEKLALGTLQRADGVVEGAISHLQDFLPKLLKKDDLMVESELDQFLVLTEAA